jgi:hypothetical protein
LAVQPVASPYTDCAIPALNNDVGNVKNFPVEILTDIITTGYGLDGREIGIPIPVGAI